MSLLANWPAGHAKQSGRAKTRLLRRLAGRPWPPGHTAREITFAVRDHFCDISLRNAGQHTSSQGECNTRQVLVQLAQLVLCEEQGVQGPHVQE